MATSGCFLHLKFYILNCDRQSDKTYCLAIVKEHSELYKINLFEHFLPLETLVVRGQTHTEINVENEQKLSFSHHYHIISLYMKSLNDILLAITIPTIRAS